MSFFNQDINSSPHTQNSKNINNTFAPSGGGTPASSSNRTTEDYGISKRAENNLGKEIIKGLKAIPDYGPLTWWAPAHSNTGLDGATTSWGIVIQTRNWDGRSHRFVRGRRDVAERTNQEAKQMGLKGILGLLIMLDYRNSTVNVFAKEMPFLSANGIEPTLQGGIASFRSNEAKEIMHEFPFKNPFSQPFSRVPTSRSQGAGNANFSA